MDVKESVLVLLANRENRALLSEILSPQYTVTHQFPRLTRPALDHAPGIDLCIVDGPSLHEYWDDLHAARSAQEPVLLPVLLLTDRQDVGLLTRDLWRIVDDVLQRPVQKLALRARIETLVRGRRLSLQVRRLSGLYEQERRVAQRFQEAAMPRALPQVPGVSFSAFYRAGTDEAQIGGDWYDALRLPDGRVILSIGDVCGSGLDAAVAMANIRQIVRGVAQIHPDPAMMLDAADRTLHAEDPERIVTAFVGVFDPVTSLLQYACAGHPRPLLRHSDGTVTEFVAFGLPLGLPVRMERSSETVEIPPDALLLLYTDGVTEATQNVLDGEARLRSVLAHNHLMRAPNVAHAIYTAAVPVQSRDDVAILTMSTVPQAGGTGKRLVRWTFDTSDVRAAQTAREACVGELNRHALSAADRSSAELVFGELIGNVVRHAPGPVEAALDWSGPAPVLHVLDRGPGFTHMSRLPADPLSEQGRGLFIISALTEDFEVTRRACGGSHARAVLSISGGARRFTTRSEPAPPVRVTHYDSTRGGNIEAFSEAE